MTEDIKAQATFADFQKLDVRIGRVSGVEPFSRAKNPSYKVAIDLGTFGVKWSSAQITNYQPTDLIGRLVVCIINFPPRNIAGFQSEVLVLGVPDNEGRTILLQPSSDVPVAGAVF